MAALAAERSITISPYSPEHGMAVFADQQRLRQILVNLVSNAIKYNRLGGTVSITCQVEGNDRVNMTVTDTGPGIRAADLERIFVPFERLGVEQTGVEGTGIGLPLARALAQAMAGHLTASSVHGEGSAFTVTLPRAVMPWGQERIDVPRPALARASRPGRRRDKNPVHRGQPGEHRGRHPLPQVNDQRRPPHGQDGGGRPGGRGARSPRPDPARHAPARHIRRRSPPPPADRAGHPDIPVAVLSAEAAPGIIRRMLASGVAAYLTKPLDLAELGRLVHSFRTKGHSDAIPGAKLR